MKEGQFSLSVIATGGGLTTRVPAGNLYNAGTVITNTARPAAGQAFLGWSGDTNGATVVNSVDLVVTMTASKIITAGFTQRPRLVIVRCLAELSRDGFELMVTGEIGARYAIQAATHLECEPVITRMTDWTTLGTVTNALGLVGFIDRSNTNFVQRFYRARQAP